MTAAPAMCPLQSKEKPREQCSVMEERIGFNSGDSRKEFFSLLRSSVSVSNWNELYAFFGVPRSMFQHYQHGQFLIPKSLFDKMLSFLPEERKPEFQSIVFSKPGNWGAVKGGKALYEKYPDEFEKRKMNGLKKLRLMSAYYARDINATQELSKDLCEFVGAFIGDGYVSDGSTVGISGHSELDKKYHGYLSGKATKLFGLNAGIVKSKDKNGIYLKLYSTNLYKMFTGRFSFPKGSKTYTVKIPDEILAASEDCVFAAVRGIFDTDGCVFFDKRKAYAKPYPRISLQMDSKPLIDQLVPILRKHFSVSTGKHSNRNDYYIEIYGHAQLAEWMRLIGFSNRRHLDKIERAPGGI